MRQTLPRHHISTLAFVAGFAAGFVAAPTLAAAQSPAPTQLAAAAPEPASIESVVIKGQALRSAHEAFSTSSFDIDQIRDQQVNQPQELFRWVPGMNVRSLGLGGVADSISLRGFGGGGHGGDIGIVIDGMPLNEAMSHADGYADLNVVIPLEIDTLTVFRGPVSPLYGNFNRGGRLVAAPGELRPQHDAEQRVGLR